MNRRELLLTLLAAPLAARQVAGAAAAQATQDTELILCG